MNETNEAGCFTRLFRVFTAAGLVAAIAGDASKAIAQDADAGWRFTLAPYLWASAQDGTIGIGPAEGDVDLSFQDILEDLSLAGMVLGEARNDRLILSLNFVGARLEDDVTDNIDSKIDNVNVAATVGYEVVDLPWREAAGEDLRFRLAPLAGARLTYLRAELDNVLGRTFDSSETFLDPLLGARVSLDLTPRWRLSGEADMGGFGVGSDRSWNAQGFLSYETIAFGVETRLAVGYRHLSQDYDDDGFDYDIDTFGPIIGAAFVF